MSNDPGTEKRTFCEYCDLYESKIDLIIQLRTYMFQLEYLVSNYLKDYLVC